MGIGALAIALVAGYAGACMIALVTILDRARLVGRLAASRTRRIALARRVKELEADIAELCRALDAFDAR